MKTKVKFALNLLLLVGILGVMYFFVRNSMMEILAGLRETSFRRLTGYGAWHIVPSD